MILTKKIIPRSSPHGWKICHCCNAQVFYVRTRHNQNFKPLRWDEELQSDTWCRKKAIWLQHGCWLQPLKTRLTRRAFQKCVRSWPLLSFAWNTVKIVDDFFFLFFMEAAWNCTEQVRTAGSQTQKQQWKSGQISKYKTVQQIWCFWNKLGVFALSSSCNVKGTHQVYSQGMLMTKWDTH